MGGMPGAFVATRDIHDHVSEFRRQSEALPLGAKFDFENENRLPDGRGSE
jgi:hypothetical protein